MPLSPLDSASVEIIDDEVSVKEIFLKIKNWWSFIVSKWVVIIIATILGGLIGLIYAINKTPIYSAKTTFVLEEENGSSSMLGQLGGLASLAGIEGGAAGGLFQGDNIIELYKSRSMIRKTLLSKVNYNGKSIFLVDLFLDINDWRKEWSKNNVLNQLSFKYGVNDSLNRVQDSILTEVILYIGKNNLSIVKPDKKLSIIKVEVRSDNEFFSKNFNDQIVKNVNDFYVQTKTKKSLENLSIVQHQTDSVRNVLNGAIYNTAAIADATPNLNPARQILRAPAQKSQFNAEANKEILKQLVQNLELAKLSLRKETPLIQIVDGPVYPLDVEKLKIINGVVTGGLLTSFLTILILVGRKFLLDLFNEK